MFSFSELSRFVLFEWLMIKMVLFFIHVYKRNGHIYCKIPNWSVLFIVWYLQYMFFFFCIVCLVDVNTQAEEVNCYLLDSVWWFSVNKKKIHFAAGEGKLSHLEQWFNLRRPCFNSILYQQHLEMPYRGYFSKCNLNQFQKVERKILSQEIYH